ncbi:PLP-dependent aminotransferase family protein [Paenibacillus sp. TRM 82003]|nr:PLP-dependent aminotransferase family protein [Paenibacillus sp. TRM 82003]
MYIELNRDAPGPPLPERIARAFEDRIGSGLLRPGEKLPSVRRLAALLGVSLVTASKAYGLLEARGAVECEQGRGCFVAEPAARAGAPAADAFAWQRQLTDYLPRAQLWNHYQHVPARLQLHLSAIQRELLPAKELSAHIGRLVTEEPQELLTGYGSFQGDPGLRETMAAWMSRVGIRAAAADLLVTSGAQQGIDLVARTFVGHGDVVVLESPTYNGAIDVFANRGARIETVPSGRYGMDVRALARICDRAKPKLIYTVPTYHNPTGATMPLERRRQLYELAESLNCLIVEDDPYSDMYFDAPPPPPIKSFDDTGRVIYIKSYSKLLGPGCRIAALAASGTILSRLVAAKTAADLGSPPLFQKAVRDFLASSRFPAYARDMRATLAARCRLAESLLRRHAPKGVSWIPVAGGLHLWLTLPDGVDDRALFLAAQREGLAVLPGAVCYPGDVEHRSVRICFSYMPEESLHESIALLGRLIDSALAPPPPPEQ